MKKYEEASIEIVVLHSADIITVSGWNADDVDLPTPTAVTPDYTSIEW